MTDSPAPGALPAQPGFPRPAPAPAPPSEPAAARLPDPPADTLADNEPDDPWPPFAPEPSTEALPDEIPVAIKVPPRFCTQCGRPWNPAWSACPGCAGFDPNPTGEPFDALSAAGGSHGGGIKSSLGLYFCLLGVSIIGTIAMMVDSTAEAQIEIFMGVLFSLIVLFWSIASFARLKPALARAGSPVWYAAAIGLGVGTFAFASICVGGLTRVFNVPDASYSEPLLKAGFGWGTVVLLVAVQPAIFEELAFRGIILSSLQDAISVRDAVIVSSLMFMILHLIPLAFLHLLAIGLALCFLRVRSGSLFPGMLMHFVHNSLCLVFEAAKG
ncbi:MAG: type II CAAX endopeptidase family protein [Phycisphaerae bacterium]|nr:type II CAAX endopeptidase family protein [Phycisphaerae bacterium]